MGYRYRETARRIAGREKVRYVGVRNGTTRGQRCVTWTQSLGCAGEPRRQVKVYNRERAATHDRPIDDL